LPTNRPLDPTAIPRTKSMKRNKTALAQLALYNHILHAPR
jgi:hypothetical protein